MYMNNITPELLTWASQFLSEKEFITKTLEIPDNFPEVYYAVYGPIVGDNPIHEKDVSYKNLCGIRTRMVSAYMRKTRTLTICGANKEVWAAYGGPQLPPEPSDRMFSWLSYKEQQASIKFWAEHALSDRILE